MKEKIYNHYPLVGICIPVYMHLEYVKRSVSSVLEQTYKNFIVVISDNSNNDIIKNYICEISDERIIYSQNDKNIGATKNINKAIEIAIKHGAEYIKILFSDDWFASSHSLEKYIEFIKENVVDVVFSGNYEVYSNERKVHICEVEDIQRIQEDISFLFRANILGAPSNLMYKVTQLFFDPAYIWLLDVDYYLRLLPGKRWEYIYEPLICIGHDGDQLSDYYLKNPIKRLSETFKQYRKYPNLHNNANRKYILSQTLILIKIIVKRIVAEVKDCFGV